MAVVFFGVISPKEPLACGDFNGDGINNIGDIVSTMRYLIESGPPPNDFDSAEYDGSQFLSILDAQFALTCIFSCGPGTFGACPSSEPPLAPVTDLSAKLHFPNRIPANVSSFDMPLTLVDFPRIEAFITPLTININGSPAVVDSITFPVPGSIFDPSLPSSSVSSLGEVRFGVITINAPSPVKADVTALIHLTVPPSGSESVLDVNWAVLSPGQAPTPDNSVYPLFYRNDIDPVFVPALVSSCCIVPGDANDDGSFNIADVTFLIARIFTGGVASHCAQSADANGDGDMNIADVTYGIARIFSSGPAPICGP